MNTCYAYILASRDNRHLTIKATSDLRHGIRHERQRIARRLGKRKTYQKLVYVETFEGLTGAVQRERELKDWSRTRVVHLVTRRNPTWKAISISGFLNRMKRAS